MRLAVFIAVISIAVLMIAAAVGPYFVPTKTYRNAIEEALADELDARVVIDGFRLRLIPYPSYTIEGFKLVSKDVPFRGMPIVEAKKVIGSLSFGAIFGGALDTDVEARDVRILYRSTEGVSNVGMMLGFTGEGVQGKASELPSPPNGDPAPSVPGDAIPSLPAPAIEPPADAPTMSPSGFRLPDLSFLREAFAGDGEEDGEEARLGTISIVRGRIEIVTDEMPQPLIVKRVSISMRDIDTRSRFSTKFRMTGSFGEQAHTALGVEGLVSADPAPGELTFQDVRANLGTMHIVADGQVGYALNPRSYNVHVASPDVSEAALVPLLSSVGWMVPAAVSWQGTFGVDATFKGTGEEGQLDLQLGAAGARFSLGDALTKEAGFPFKLKATVSVTPASYTIREGALSLEGAQVGLKGSSERSDEMMSRLSMSAAGLTASSMKALLPWFPEVDDVEGGTAEVHIEGALSKVSGFNVEGRFGAATLGFAGHAFNDVAATFLRDGERIEVSTLQAAYGGAKLSGNGTLSENDAGQSAMAFDVVLGEIEMQSIEALQGAAQGSASVVAKVACSGRDRFSLMRSLTLAGSLVAPQAALSGWTAGGGVFSDATWSALTEKAGVQLNESEARALASSDGEVSDLKASFGMGESGLEVEGVTWKDKLYDASLGADIGENGRLSLSGTIAVNAVASAKLVSAGEARKKLFDSADRLILPVKGEGSMGRPNLRLDGDALAAMIEGRLKPRPMVDEKDEATEEAQKASASKEPEPSAASPEKKSPQQAPSSIKAIKAPVIEIEPVAPKTEVGETPKAVEEASGSEASVSKQKAEVSLPTQVEDEAKIPAPEPAKTATPASSDAQKKKASTAKSAPASAPKKRSKTRKTQSHSNQPVEDILKVIIGD